MSQSKIHLLACLLACGCATQLLAGPLAIDTTVYTQGATVWHGTTEFQGHNADGSESGLHGFVDWAVYAPGVWAASGFTGFSASDYVYAYQINSDGTAPLSSFSVNLGGPTDEVAPGIGNIGDFSGNNGFGPVAGASADFSFIDPFLTANWSFTAVNGLTEGLAYSSINGPMNSTGITIDDSTIGSVIPVPSPAPTNAPEPGTLMLASCGFAVLALQWLRRRAAKVTL